MGAHGIGQRHAVAHRPIRSRSWHARTAQLTANGVPLAFYSSYGGLVDIAAPGGDIGPSFDDPRYLVPASTFVVDEYGPHIGATDFNGTSAAAPHVSAVAALVKAKHPDWTAYQVRLRVLATATEQKGKLGRQLFGEGLVDAELATRK